MPVEGAAQIGLELEALDRVLMHRGIEDGVAVTTRRLRPVHRDIGVADELVAATMLGGADGDTDARAGEHLL